ncbi:MAG: NAD+ synthase [Burkholderiales bacterium]|nr:NAD+ synthase [Burkholderiales bacterium]
MTLQLSVAQLNFTVGDMPGNARKIIDAARTAYQRGVRLLITPELAICGYAAEDLFLRPSFIAACQQAVALVQTELAGLQGMHVVVGHPSGDDKRTRSVAVQQRFNMASVFCEGRLIASYAKRELPNYQVFDERRYFIPGQDACVFEVDGVKIGLLICEDAWFEQPAFDACEAGAQLLVVMNASPFHRGKSLEREDAMRVRALATGLPLVYAHLVGAQDEVVFEGRSFALQSDGELAGRAPGFVEDAFEVSCFKQFAKLTLSAEQAPMADDLSDVWRALVLGVRDYIGKNRFPSVLLGLSGGIDSALVMAIAVDALGADRVRAVMMPSPYTAGISLTDAREMAQRMQVRYDELSIVPMFNEFLQTLAPDFQRKPVDTAEENIQARIRGTLLMAMSNKHGSIVLTTGNKSEMATGYCTLYGDMAGGFAVIKDVSKTLVYQLANWRNLHDPFNTCAGPIPERIITRAPSAELREDQTDQDSLPAYDVLDAIVERYMEQDQSQQQIEEAGYQKADVDQVIRLIRINEYKRRQAPIGVRITHRGFGKDWRYPITSLFRA